MPDSFSEGLATAYSIPYFLDVSLPKKAFHHPLFHPHGTKKKGTSNTSAASGTAHDPLSPTGANQGAVKIVPMICAKGLFQLLFPSAVWDSAVHKPISQVKRMPQVSGIPMIVDTAFAAAVAQITLFGGSAVSLMMKTASAPMMGTSKTSIPGQLMKIIGTPASASKGTGWQTIMNFRHRRPRSLSVPNYLGFSHTDSM